MRIENIYDLFLVNPVVTTDSRNCPKGSLFFALKGDNFNGNRFAAKALESGCVYAIIDEPEYKQSDQYILVPDVLQTLSQLAAYHRKQMNKPVIAITGTNGKTTTKELIVAVLKSKYEVCATTGNLNNHIGVPLTLLKATAETDIIVTEMGANHMGEIAHLCTIAQPNFGLITNIGKAHLEGFGSYENIIQTKGELYHFIRNTHGHLFINSSDPVLMSISEGISKTSYGDNENGAFNLQICKQDPFLHLSYSDGMMEREIVTHFIGGYNLINFQAAITVGLQFDVPIENILEQLALYTPQNNRSQLTKTQNNTIIQDAYNANPSSVALAIQNFKDLEHPLKYVILGDMKELREFAIAEHQKIVDSLLNSPELTIVLIGPEFVKTQTTTVITKFETIDDARLFFQMSKPKNFLILLKGSRSMKMEALIEYL